MISGSRTSGSAPLSLPTATAPPRSTRATHLSRRLAADAAAAAVIATVAPLCLLQAPNAIAWAMASVGTAADGTQRPMAVLRAAGLALPAMAAVGGVAAIAAARLRAWPVLLAGLLTMAVADGLGVSARTVALIGSRPDPAWARRGCGHARRPSRWPGSGRGAPGNYWRHCGRPRR